MMIGPAMKWHCALALLMLGSITSQAAADPADPLPDWDMVSEIFNERCVMCHSGHGAALGLRLDSYEAAMAGSSRGAILIPGDAERSELIRRLHGRTLPRMPFFSRTLPSAEIDIITRWVDAGLPNAALRPDKTSKTQ
ncbi:Planctomycete cytochrome C [Limimaricola pyoseonensis]|uniref:Planctomycete cytochrome C n=1 Tax=Limimaricola pyoseonensis TaxID=521013 RepID=A0A1G7K4F5_9RHOB|nr:Planctomycete cytochrome C [Limimaricola pyoseonensis]